MNKPALLVAVLASLSACSGGADAPPDATPDVEVPPEVAPPEAAPQKPRTGGTNQSGPDSAPATDHACFETGERGVIDKPLTLLNASDVEAVTAACAAAGGGADDCDPTKVLGQETVLCFAAMSGDDLEVKLMNSVEMGGPEAQPARLVYQVATPGCGKTVVIDATNGRQLMASRCMKGRPCSIGTGKRVARAVVRAGWSA